MSNSFQLPEDLLKTVTEVIKKESVDKHKAFGLTEKTDPINKASLKKKFADRKDKDIDNDGDEDSSDEYLHKRRKAISKAMSAESKNSQGELEQVDEDEGKKAIAQYSRFRAADYNVRNPRKADALMKRAKKYEKNMKKEDKLAKESTEEALWSANSQGELEQVDEDMAKADARNKASKVGQHSFQYKGTWYDTSTGKPAKSYGRHDEFDDESESPKDRKRGSYKRRFKEERSADKKQGEMKPIKQGSSSKSGDHKCAKHVTHEQWGEGNCIFSKHANPDEQGNIEWYDVMFEHGIEKNVPTKELEVHLYETHKH